jgi:hypothetical protein
MSREVKKLSWFERNVLCMKVERKTIQDNQQLILHRLSGAQTAEPTPIVATSYAAWHTDRYSWCDMEKHLFAPPAAPEGDAHAEAEEDMDDDNVGGDDDAGGDDYANDSDNLDD